VQGVQVHPPQPNVVKKTVNEMHKMQQLKHFLLTKLMNYRHTYLASYALKLLYGNLGSKKFSGGQTPEFPFKVDPPAKNPGYAYALV
jgi:hypothetical protein